MKILTKIFDKLILVICIAITYCVITPAILIVTLLSKSFMLGFITQASTMMMKAFNKTDLKSFRKHDAKNYIAQAFYFSYDMREHYFVGEKFKDFDFGNMKYNIESGIVSRLVNEAGVEGFFFELSKEVFEVLDKDTTLYNGYDISENHFAIHFNIKKEAYQKAMRNFQNWS